LHINGEILEERKALSTNKLININGGKLYLIKFNEKVYDELEEKDLLERRKNKKNCNEKKKSKMMLEKKPKMNYYDILKNILHRKGTNNLILNILYKIILNDETKEK
jgi:DNA-binding transcriptional regulator YhcF (GntR family)